MFTIKQTRAVIDSLNQIFVSEAHLQLAFAMQAESLYHDKFDYFPEFPVYGRVNVKERDEFDLLIRDKDDQSETLIEFKYKTKNSKSNPQKWELKSKVEVALANHAAQNNGCYDCWSDIGRIEKYVKSGRVKNGFFIFITNDSLYWKGGNNDSNYRSLNMKQDEQKKGLRGFAPEIKDEDERTRKFGNRSGVIKIENDYSFHYSEYNYKPKGEGKFSDFKVLIVSIDH